MQEDTVLEEGIDRTREARDKHRIEEMYNCDLDPFDEETLVIPIDDKQRPNLRRRQ